MPRGSRLEGCRHQPGCTQGRQQPLCGRRAWEEPTLPTPHCQTLALETESEQVPVVPSHAVCSTLFWQPRETHVTIQLMSPPPSSPSSFRCEDGILQTRKTYSLGSQNHQAGFLRRGLAAVQITALLDFRFLPTQPSFPCDQTNGKAASPFFCPFVLRCRKNGP